MPALTAIALTTLAIVAQDATPLRAAPSASAANHAQLWQGELLEVRGSRLDHLQVYDHRREPAGYVRASQVRVLPASDAEAPQLLAVLRFLRDTPGAESLGIAYVAGYLKAAPAGQITAEPFDALVLDLMLPDGDGLDLCRELRADAAPARRCPSRCPRSG